MVLLWGFAMNSIPLAQRLASLLAFVPFTVGLGVTTPSVGAATQSDPPRQWAPNAFLPLTEARIAALPPAEQPPWRASWQASQERARPLSPRDLADHSSTVPSDGPPIPSTYSQGVRLDAPTSWYASQEARTIADRVVGWQLVTGGWTKTGDYSRVREAKDDKHDSWSAGTFDNDSTIYELRYLALVSNAADDQSRVKAWRESFLRGLDYVFAAQYPNGGFPQIYPLAGLYHDAITFNDDAMVHILELLRDIAEGKSAFAFVPAGKVTEAGDRFQRGLQCVLAAQLHLPGGHRSVWGQQYDPLTLQPCAARNFEPVAECTSESAGIVQFLLTVSNPTPEIMTALDGATAWFASRVLHGVAWDRELTTGSGLVLREGAPDLWARFYEIGTGKPIFGERDRAIHYRVTELLNERRKGYGWFNSRPAAVLTAYKAWQKKLFATPK